MVFFTKGAGSHSIDFNKFTIQPFQIYFMIPGQVHSWNFEGDVDGYVINFTAEFFQSFLLRADYLESFSFFNGIAEDSVINLNEELKEPVQDLFEDILTESSIDNSLQRDVIRVILLRLFLLLKQQNIKKDIFQQPNYTLLRNFQKLIEKHYTELRLPKDYADLLFVTPNHLNALCKAATGMQA